MIVIYIIIGFIAQLIDGTLGIGYGVCCRTFLKAFANVPSKVISSVVHFAEVPTSFISMIAHFKYKNIDKKLFINLIFPGIIGSIIGAYIVILNFNWIELIIDFYLIIMGFVILVKSFNKNNNYKKINNKYFIRFLGFIGAFFDASGGGGWGPIVAANLLKNSNDPKKIIGTVNATEFFVTLSSSITFIIFIVNIKKYLLIVLGLIIGGIIAAPLSAKLCKRRKDKKIYFIVGLLLIVLNIYNLILLII